MLNSNHGEKKSMVVVLFEANSGYASGQVGIHNGVSGLIRGFRRAGDIDTRPMSQARARACATRRAVVVDEQDAINVQQAAVVTAESEGKTCLRTARNRQVACGALRNVIGHFTSA